MKPNKQNPDFLYIGSKLLAWYKINARELPWRTTKNPYKIWICEIILQQTQVKQGTMHYLEFIKRFPDVQTLANAETDEVLLYWKGLGYYSRALNLHKAAKQIMEDYQGVFPKDYNDILKLKGVGKYTAAAISSICFNENKPAVDGNFYRVLSRIFADDYDVSNTQAFAYFAELAHRIMPNERPGDFNQAMMDIGAEVCKPKNPKCDICPIQKDCAAFGTGNILSFPVKTKKVKAEDLALHYYFVAYKNVFLIRRRTDDFIWKKLYEFPTEIPAEWQNNIVKSEVIKHKLTHKNLSIQIDFVAVNTEKEFADFAHNHQLQIVNLEDAKEKSFPKPLENYLEVIFKD